MEESGLPMDEVLAGNDVLADREPGYCMVSFVLGDSAEVPFRVPVGTTFEVPFVERLIAQLARRNWCCLRVERW